MTDKNLKEKYEKYDRPSNCEELTVRKLNAEIWGQISHAKKQQDLRLANVQNAVVKAGFTLTNSVGAMLKAYPGGVRIGIAKHNGKVTKFLICILTALECT